MNRSPELLLSIVLLALCGVLVAGSLALRLGWDQLSPTRALFAPTVTTAATLVAPPGTREVTLRVDAAQVPPTLEPGQAVALMATTYVIDEDGRARPQPPTQVPDLQVMAIDGSFRRPEGPPSRTLGTRSLTLAVPEDQVSDLVQASHLGHLQVLGTPLQGNP